jgi:hypothetical protein
MPMSQTKRMKPSKVVVINERLPVNERLPFPCQHADPEASGLRYLVTRVSRPTVTGGSPPIVIIEQVYELLKPMSNVEVLREQKLLRR